MLHYRGLFIPNVSLLRTCSVHVCVSILSILPCGEYEVLCVGISLFPSSWGTGLSIVAIICVRCVVLVLLKLFLIVSQVPHDKVRQKSSY